MALLFSLSLIAADKVILKNGEVFTGSVRGSSNDRIQFTTENGEKNIPLDAIRCLLRDDAAITIPKFPIRSVGREEYSSLFQSGIATAPMISNWSVRYDVVFSDGEIIPLVSSNTALGMSCRWHREPLGMSDERYADLVERREIAVHNIMYAMDRESRSTFLGLPSLIREFTSSGTAYSSSWYMLFFTRDSTNNCLLFQCHKNSYRSHRTVMDEIIGSFTLHGLSEKELKDRIGSIEASNKAYHAAIFSNTVSRMRSLQSVAASAVHPSAGGTNIISIDLPITMQESCDDITNRLGNGYALSTNSDRTKYSLRYERLGVWCFFTATGDLSTIRIDAPFSGTIEGVAIGDMITAHTNRLGTPSGERTPMLDGEAWRYIHATRKTYVIFIVDPISSKVKRMLVY